MKLSRACGSAVVVLGLLAAAPAPAPASSVPASSAFVANGSVNAITTDAEGRSYIGGTFTMVGPRLGNAIAVSTTSGDPASGFPEVSGGEVLAATGDGAGGWFLGGTFTRVGGVPRSRLVHVNADHTLDATWNPNPDGAVRALARSGDELFAGGDFAIIGGAERPRLAKLTTGGSGQAVTAFDAGLTSTSVRALAISGASLYLGGNFLFVGEEVRPSLAKVAAATGAVDPTWNPAPNFIVDALAVTADAVYAGGQFNSIGGADRTAVAKLSPTGTGAADPNFDAKLADGARIKALATAGTDVFLGGEFDALGSTPVQRPNLAKVSATGALDTGWTPQFGVVNALAVDGSSLYVGAEGSATNLARISTTGTGARDAWSPNPDADVLALAVAGSGVLAGGRFASAGPRNVKRQGLARLAPDGSLDTTWDAALISGQVTALALAGSTLYAGGEFDAGPGRSPYLAKWSTTGAGGSADANWVPASNSHVTALAATGGAVYFAKFPVDPDSLIKVSGTGAGLRDTNWDPDVDGLVEALAVSDSSLYIAGQLIEVDGANRGALAKLALTDTGAADPAWTPAGNQPGFRALAVSGDSVYVGGDFTGSVGGRPATRLAKLSAGGSGAADPAFEGSANGSVRALALDGSELYAGGAFGMVGGQPRARLARLSASTGAVDPTFTPGMSGTVRALAASPTRVIAGGEFDSVDGYAARGIALFNRTTPAVTIAAPLEGARYRLGQVVNADYSCSGTPGDPEPVTCSGTVPAGSPIDTSTAGVKSFTATATANLGNAASKTVSYVVDASAPLIQIGALPGGASYAIGERVPVTYSCTDADGDTDVASCAGPVSSGGLLNTTTAGAHVFTVTASDRAGNTATASVSYSVRPAAPAPLTPVDVSKPALTAVTLTPAAFRAERSGSPTGKDTGRRPRRGTRVAFRLSEAAKVTFTVIRPKKGRIRAKTLGRFTVTGNAGLNRFVLRGRVGGKTIAPGRYQLRAQAADAAGNKSALVTKSFTVKR